CLEPAAHPLGEVQHCRIDVGHPATPVRSPSNVTADRCTVTSGSGRPSRRGPDRAQPLGVQSSMIFHLLLALSVQLTPLSDPPAAVVNVQRLIEESAVG